MSNIDYDYDYDPTPHVDYDDADALVGYAAMFGQDMTPQMAAAYKPKPFVPKARPVVVTRPSDILPRHWSGILRVYRSLVASGFPREKARREIAVLVEVWAWQVIANMREADKMARAA